MIHGFVRANEARVKFKIIEPNKRQHEIEAVIDTGFNGSLTLPPAIVQSLRLKWQSFGHGTLADGTDCVFEVYEATVIWNRRIIRVLVQETGSDPLVGMELLSGHELKIEVCEGGNITIKRLP